MKFDGNFDDFCKFCSKYFSDRLFSYKKNPQSELQHDYEFPVY